jgi:hypothetical protein
MFHLFKRCGGGADAEHGAVPALVELAAFHLYPYFGKGGTREPWQIQLLIDAVTELNQLRGWGSGIDVDQSDPDLAQIQVHVRAYAESVRGSAYPHQIRHRIEQIQGPFEGWFCSKVGIGPLRALAIFDAFERSLNENFQALRERFKDLGGEMGSEKSDSNNQGHLGGVSGEAAAVFSEELPLGFPVSFSQLNGIIPRLTLQEWESLRDLIGLTSDSHRNIQQAREVKERPVYFLSENRFIFIDSSSVYDALFDVFDKLTRGDTQFRDRHYIVNLKTWMESKVCEYLRRLFPTNAVYQELVYPDPDHIGGETELDAAVLWGPFLLLIEVKGKQFRPGARVGNPYQLKRDLKENIEDAFTQATRAMRFIGGNATVAFVEKGTGRKLLVRKDDLRRVFPLSVTLHHFGGLATQLALLKGIGLFKESAYPWSVSIADLDIVTQFGSSPDVFLHYVQRRLDLQRSEKRLLGDELDVFGLYLDSRLHPSQFWERKTDEGEPFSSIMFTGGGDRFDLWFQAEAGIPIERPKIHLNLPNRFAAIIDELRRRDEDSARWIAFALLGLSQETVASIDADLEMLRNRATRDGRVVRVTLRDGDVVVSVMASRSLTKAQLLSQSAMRASVEKYRLKTTCSVAIGINPNDTVSSPVNRTLQN